jgi:hypothetical protein
VLELTKSENHYCCKIRQKDRELRTFLGAHAIDDSFEPTELLRYLTGIKRTLGNLSNDLSFVATLLAKNYLERRFHIVDFDAGAKAQGASGVDVSAKTPEGKTVVGEIKTTTPYQPGFGAAQRIAILKDLARLANSAANHRLMLVVDPESFATLRSSRFAGKAPGVEVINLVSGEGFTLP